MNANNALKKVFTLKRVIFAVYIIAILAMIVTPLYVKNSRNKVARDLMRQIVLAEGAVTIPPCVGYPKYAYAFTDGSFGEPAGKEFMELVGESAEENIFELAKFGFRPYQSVAFHIIPPAPVNGKIPKGFIAFTAHNSVGSTVYVYDSLAADGTGKLNKNTDYRILIDQSVKAAYEGAEYGGIKFTSSVATLFRYEFHGYNEVNPIEKKTGETKYGPKPGDKYPARMVVTIPADQ